jgi:hypothetical protein
MVPFGEVVNGVTRQTLERVRERVQMQMQVQGMSEQWPAALQLESKKRYWCERAW